MKELSLHILDIIQNSLKAGATCVEIRIEETEDIFRFSVKDNGSGMDEALLKRVRDPFTTTRTTRNIGLGIPLLEAATTQCNGRLEIFSTVGRGTEVVATFQHSHIDRAPLGDIAQTMVTVISGSPQIRFVYTHCCGSKTFVFSTEEAMEILQDVPLNTPEVLQWIAEHLKQGIEEIQEK